MKVVYSLLTEGLSQVLSQKPAFLTLQNYLEQFSRQNGFLKICQN